MKKKILIIMLIIALAMTSVFAAGKFHLGAMAGSASMTEKKFEANGLVQNESGTRVGLGVDLRADFDLTSEATVTAIVGWQMPDRTFLDEKPVEEKQQHYISVFLGYTFDTVLPELETLDGDPVDLTWKMSIGPEFVVNCCSGKIGIGGGAILRGNFALANNLALSVVVKDTFVVINDKPAGTWAPYNNVGLKLGCTYNF